MNNVIFQRETIRETLKARIKVFTLFCALFGLNLPIFAQSCLSKIQVQGVEVLVDDIYEEGISLQILGIAKNALNCQKIIEKANASGAARKNNYTIRINFRERSFYKNVDNFHSLYASYQLFSEDGKCVLENVFCSESKKSILSTLVQQKQVEKIARDIKKYFENEIKSAV